MTSANLEDELNTTLLKLVRLYHHRLPPLYESALTMVQFITLSFLVEGERTAGDLASCLQVSPSAVSGTVDRLVELGLAERRPDAKDRRLVWISATAEGRHRKDEFEDRRREVTEQVFASLSAGEKATLIRLLEKVVGRDDNGR